MMFKLSNTLFATAVALFMVSDASAAYTFARRDVALAKNDVDACNGHNNYGIGHSCAFSTVWGTSQGTCQLDSASNLYCVPNKARRSVAVAKNDVDACNGHNDYGIGHSCKFTDNWGTSEGTCQLDSSKNLYCVPNLSRRSAALAANPVDACNGHNDYGVGHSCAFHSSLGKSEGTCQIDGSGIALYCAVKTAARRDIALAANPVDACNGHNNYGIGHSCAFHSSLGKSEGTCQIDSSGIVLYCEAA